MTEERPTAGGQRASRGTVADVLLSARYGLGDELGSGTAGHVYRAFDVLLEREIAVKVLDRIRDDVGVARAVRAARAAARARHDRLIDVHDVERGRPPFVTLGVVAGRPLTAALGTQRLPRTQALRVAEDLLGALAALHRVGAVHRDVGLDNVWLGDDGRAWLTSAGLTEAACDPGLGLRVGADPERRPAKAPSPEQGLGLEADARSDVTGAATVLRALLQPDSGDPVTDVLARAGHSDPDRRYRDAGELWVALRDAVAAPAPPQPVPQAGPPPQPPVTGTEERQPVGPPRPVPHPMMRIALGAAAVTAVWLLVAGPLSAPRIAQPAASQPGATEPAVVATPTGATPPAVEAVPPSPVVQTVPPPDQLPPEDLRRILDSAAASTVDLGPDTAELFGRLRDLDRLRGIVREAEAAELYGRAALDAAAATNSAPLSAEVAELLRPELTVDGLVALVDRDPAAVGSLARTFATRLRVLDTLEGEALQAEVFDLSRTAERGAAEGSLSAQFDVTARTVLAEIVQP